MHPTKQIYPPMQSLRALEAFARLGVVWEAAEELGITRSALSHRLATLESILGFDVAVRSGKGVALTPRGRRYAQEVQKSLELLREAREDENKPLEGSLRISSTPGFASMWLCNHLASFRAEHPDLDLQILVNRELDRPSDPDADLYIMFGDGNWPRQHVQHLYDVEFQPMCSPALLNMHTGLKEPADLLRFALLHLNDQEDWRQWFSAAGLQFPRRASGIRFPDLMMIQSAAISGQGIMMGDVITCAVPLAGGQLVTPFNVRTRARGAYYLVRNRQKRPGPAVVGFTRWLRTLFKRINPELQVGPLS